MWIVIACGILTMFPDKNAMKLLAQRIINPDDVKYCNLWKSMKSNADYMDWWATLYFDDTGISVARFPRARVCMCVCVRAYPRKQGKNFPRISIVISNPGNRDFQEMI